MTHDRNMAPLNQTTSRSSSSDSLNQVGQQASTPSVELNICNVFWRPNLACHPYQYGDALVCFGELWPGDDRLAPLVSCFTGSDMLDAVTYICMLALRCGPVRVLKQMVEQKIIGPAGDLGVTSFVSVTEEIQIGRRSSALSLDQVFEHGKTMLHIACLSSNPEAVQYLISQGIDFKRADKSGRTADMCCFSARTRKALPVRYHTGASRYNLRHKKPISEHDKKDIFDLAQKPECLEELLYKLHTMDFDVNRDVNARGDLLIHVAVRTGLSQLPLLINLVKNFDADIEAHDRYGMTPLCLAAKYDMEIIAELLICILGADPNSCDRENKWTPLHYAAKKNNINIVDCLCKRGADVNMEDKDGIRADDLALQWGNEECCKLIESLRDERCQQLSYLVQKGNLKLDLVRVTDLFNVDVQGRTLIMAATEANRCDNLGVLLRINRSPINAQHTQTGRTALSIAARKGYEVAVKTLLDFNALPGIRDMWNRAALHYACMEGHQQIAMDLVREAKGLTGLFEGLRLTKDEDIRNILREALDRRQTQIVNPALFESAMDGEADRIFAIIEEGDDMNPQTGTGDWPMYMAAGNGHLEVMQLLYEHGGDVSGRHPNTKSTVLHVACSRGLYNIVKYLLQFCKYGGYLGFFATTNVSCYQELDINSLNNHGQTALQVAASKGYSRIVKTLLDHGASSAVLDVKGQLYKCREFEGVQVLIERHRRSRTEQIMLCIKDRKRLGYLRRMWQAKFDHNLRNKNGDTPLMVACYYGRTEAVKFLLESAIQSMEDEERDFERSLQQWRRDSDDDSGTFERSHSPSQMRRSMGSLPDMSTDISTTDYSDQEFAERQETYYSHLDYPEIRDNAAYHRRRRKKRAQFLMANASLDEGNEIPGGNDTGYSNYRVLPYMSDSELFEDSYEGIPKGYTDVPGRYPTRSASVYSYGSAGGGTLSMWSGMSDASGRISPTVGMSGYFGQHSGPSIFQGNQVNHLCAVNLRDHSSCFHRAVECTDQKAGLAVLNLLLEKDKSMVNSQNIKGLTPLHLACHMEKKKIVKKLVSLKYVDVNIRTLDGKLPDDLTRSKRLAKVVQSSREKPAEVGSSSAYTADGISTPPASSVGGASIDFDRLNARFEELKKGVPL